MLHIVSCLVALAISALTVAASAVAGGARPLILAEGAPEVCTQVYQPVCGTDPNGRRVTYSNECFARVAKATNVTPGDCPR